MFENSENEHKLISNGKTCGQKISAQNTANFVQTNSDKMVKLAMPARNSTKKFEKYIKKSTTTIFLDHNVSGLGNLLLNAQQGKNSTLKFSLFAKTETGHINKNFKQLKMSNSVKKSAATIKTKGVLASNNYTRDDFLKISFSPAQEAAQAEKKKIQAEKTKNEQQKLPK